MFRQLALAMAVTTTLCGGTLGEALAAQIAPKVTVAGSDRVSAASTVKPKRTANLPTTSSPRPDATEPSNASNPSGPSDPSDLSDPMNVFRVPKNTRQMIVGITDGWAGNRAQLQRFTRKSGAWKALDSKPIAAVLGPKGLAWGRGLNPVPTNAISAAGGAGVKRIKREGDKRSPAGVFPLGKAYGYDPLWAARTKLEYVTVTPADLFIEDANSEFYNNQIRLDHPATSDWELSQQMEQTDPAHRLEVVVGHNTPAPIRGAGSAILLHIWRQNGKKFTTGCTAMADGDIETIIRWLDPKAHPLYVLLPRSEYLARQVAWGLPALDSSPGAATSASSGTASASGE